ncbi:MAG TPA: 3'(2'),5'-bisphosphate nucleotidase CysQ [Mangrovimonas sp.]|nr:3'(2'),5'-bisphosphate nucleotidase CysQ [Mangrovimonas sp.]
MIDELLFSNELKVAIVASLNAGKAIMEVYNTTFEIEYKEDSSPLTEADKRSNSIINQHLIATKTPIISEENRQIAFSEREKWTQCWVVDPVDGTKEFIKRNGEFTVNIALVKEGKPQLGVIYAPAMSTLYFAEKSLGKAFKVEIIKENFNFEDILKKAEVIRPRSVQNQTIKVVGSRSHMNQDTMDYLESLKRTGNKVEMVSKGSSLKFCIVAEGEANIYPRFAPTMEWDTAAGQAICEAVGLKVISQDTNEPMRYNKENLLNSYFLVSK